MSKRFSGSRIGLVAAGLAAAVGLSASGAMAHGKGDRQSDREPVAFSEVDANGDGSVDAAEILAWMESRRALRLQQMIERADSDGDGVLSETELQELLKHQGGRRAKHGDRRRK